ncbi:MAG TPA: hypothetical protein PLE61_00080 [Vicinamibacterales bacterium]|nr:hypothetical protein [Vicinamibacterales bacterium]HPW19184.1 hypothetical protein [Vicinamibacterales bacterium]
MKQACLGLLSETMLAGRGAEHLRTRIRPSAPAAPGGARTAERYPVDLAAALASRASAPTGAGEIVPAMACVRAGVPGHARARFAPAAPEMGEVP